MVLSGTYISDTPINVMSKIESDPIVAGDPELSRLAHKKKIAALHTLYVNICAQETGATPRASLI